VFTLFTAQHSGMSNVRFRNILGVLPWLYLGNCPCIPAGTTTLSRGQHVAGELWVQNACYRHSCTV